MATRKWSPEFESRLLISETYREFLSAFFEKKPLWSTPRPLTFQEFANRSGFSSKAFLKDVIVGRKRLTPRSLPPTAQGLGLNRVWTDFFECLVSREEVSFQIGAKDRLYFEYKIEASKRKILKKKSAQMFTHPSDLVHTFLEPSFPEVFASLGSNEAGADLQMISRRSRVRGSQLVSILEKMKKAGLVTTDGTRFWPLVQSLDAKDLKTDAVFRDDYFRALDKVRRRFDKQSGTESSLFLSQTFSVSSPRLSEFKKQLSNLIRDFSIEAENEEGDCIAEITLAFTNNLT